MASLLAGVLAFAALAEGPAPDLREILGRAFNNLEKNERVADNYNYKERRVVRHLDGDGQVKKTEITTYDVVQIEGTPWRRLIARDDKPLPPNEERKEQERLDKETRKRASESPAARAKRLREHEKEQREGEEMVREILDAYDFRLVAHENIGGIPCLVIEGTPRAGFQPRKKDARFLKYFAGRLWISEQNNDLVKLEANVLDDISFGWFLAKLRKGGRFEFARTRVNEEVWLPHSLSVRVSARALVKQLNRDISATFYDYKKFQVESRITAIGEEKNEKP